MITPVINAKNPKNDLSPLSHNEKLNNLFTQLSNYPLRKKIILGLFIIQFVLVTAWSWTLYSHFALTKDFGIFFQALRLISSGHFDPYDSLNGFYYWQSHGEFIAWILAVPFSVYPHAMTLLTIQNIAFVLSEIVVIFWIIEELEKTTLTIKTKNIILSFTLILLVLNPWTYWANSFDFHYQTLAVLFALLTTKNLISNRSRATIWAIMTFFCGDVTSTYILAISVVIAIFNKKNRKLALSLLGLSSLWIVFLSLIHANLGTPISSNYGYLLSSKYSNPGMMQLILAILRHPSRAIFMFLSHKYNIYANLAPTGFIGLFSPVALGINAIILLENNLSSNNNFSSPLFQNFPLYIFGPLGTGLVFIKIFIKYYSKKLPYIIVTILSINTILWFFIWIPKIYNQFERIPTKSSVQLAKLKSHIPSSAEVFTNQAIVGRFSNRVSIYYTQTPKLKISNRNIFFIFTPYMGISTTGPSTILTQINFVSQNLKAQLILHKQGIWAFYWKAPKGLKYINIPTSPEILAAWALKGSASTPYLTTNPKDRYMASNGKAGFVFQQAYWREPVGNYNLKVTMSSSVPTFLEAWNTTGNQLLFRQELPPTNGFTTITKNIQNPVKYKSHIFEGWGPFVDSPVTPVHNQIEIRLWTYGGGVVNVRSLQLLPSTLGG